MTLTDPIEMQKYINHTQIPIKLEQHNARGIQKGILLLLNTVYKKMGMEHGNKMLKWRSKENINTRYIFLWYTSITARNRQRRGY
jgi:hypothetical protein